MARPRTVKAHKGLPRGWRWHRGAYRYRVPKGQEQHWDGKTEFRLGSTLPEAHRTYAGRIASVDGAIVSFAQLFDRYLVEVTVGKAQSTQADEVRHISKLREMIGSNPVVLFKPHHAYQLRDSIHRAVVNGSGERYTNRVMEKLKHTLTKAVEWGVIEHHPMNDLKFKMLPIPRNSQIRRAVSLEQVIDSLDHAPAWLQCYVKLKLMTGLRQVDLLLMTQRNITDEGILVTHHKTENSTGKTTLYQWTPELSKVIQDIKGLKPYSIHLFKNQKGGMFWNEKRGREASGFHSAWMRWMRKLPEHQRFSERSIRNLVGSEDNLEEASKRLGHAHTSTTAKFYRLKPTVVSPLVPNTG